MVECVEKTGEEVLVENLVSPRGAGSFSVTESTAARHKCAAYYIHLAPHCGFIGADRDLLCKSGPHKSFIRGWRRRRGALR